MESHSVGKASDTPGRTLLWAHNKKLNSPSLSFNVCERSAAFPHVMRSIGTAPVPGAAPQPRPRPWCCESASLACVTHFEVPFGRCPRSTHKSGLGATIALQIYGTARP